MKVLIIEDEHSVAQNLCDILLEIDSSIEVMTIIESVQEAIKWIDNNPKPDLGFFDIRLADGDSFEIFEKVQIQFPIIFTSAYDEYALRAFKVNSIDYLVKPINRQALEVALDKYKSIYTQNNVDYENLLQTISELRQTKEKHYKKSLLVYIRDQIIPVSMDNVAYFNLSNGIVYCTTHNDQSYHVDQTLEEIGNQIDPQEFFRANRQFIVSRQAVKAASQYFQRKLKINLNPVPREELIISKAKVTEFKKWLEQ